jgi:oxalate decarboxylase/phosphoglucose isomerase-like protein (cupin superfamily)
MRHMVPTEEHLSGKVRKWTLPRVSPGPQADGVSLKRLVLMQGELAQIYDAEEGIRYIACIELAPGAVRGNHFHKFKSEWVYVLSGSTDLLVKEPGAGTAAALNLAKGDLAFIATGVAHALKVTGAGEAIEFSPVKFDPADIYRHQVT